MRTTVAIDDDVLEAARKLAAARNQSLGRTISELMRRGLSAGRQQAEPADRFPTFSVRDDSGPITIDDVKADEDEAD